jgi:hypothetical protein
MSGFVGNLWALTTTIPFMKATIRPGGVLDDGSFEAARARGAALGTQRTRYAPTYSRLPAHHPDGRNHRTLNGNRAGDPRCPLPGWSRRTRGVHDQEAQRGVRTQMNLGCGPSPGEAFPGRQGFCVRERSTPPGDEIAAVVTRSHPAILLGEVAKADAHR